MEGVGDLSAKEIKHNSDRALRVINGSLPGDVTIDRFVFAHCSLLCIA